MHSTIKKGVIEETSRRSAKRIKDYCATDWGHHIVGSLVPGTGSTQDTPRFLKHLGALSKLFVARTEITAQATSNLRMLKSKNKLLIQQQFKVERSSYYFNFPEHNVISPILNRSNRRPVIYLSGSNGSFTVNVFRLIRVPDLSTYQSTYLRVSNGVPVSQIICVPQLARESADSLAYHVKGYIIHQ